MALSQLEIRSVVDSLEREFLPYQIRYIYDRSNRIAVRKAVRTGITYAHSYKAAKKRLFWPHQKPIREIFASKNRTVAGEYLGYHRKWAEAWNHIFPNSIPISDWTSEKAIYPGGEILIVSSDPDAFRGMEGDVTLDEFAFHEQQEALYAASQSRMQWLGDDGQLHLISSSAHPETCFERVAKEWEAHSGKRKDGLTFSVHRVTLPEAVDEGLALKVPGAHQRLLKAA
jgi:phage FluMu gp28-like protein